jgi:hypothetical protein
VAAASTPEAQGAARLEPLARARAEVRRLAARLAALAAAPLVAEEPELRLLAAPPTEPHCSEAAVVAALCEPVQLEVAAAVQRQAWVPQAASRPRSSSLRQSKEA